MDRPTTSVFLLFPSVSGTESFRILIDSLCLTIYLWVLRIMIRDVIFTLRFPTSPFWRWISLRPLRVSFPQRPRLRDSYSSLSGCLFSLFLRTLFYWPCAFLCRRTSLAVSWEFTESHPLASSLLHFSYLLRSIFSFSDQDYENSQKEIWNLSDLNYVTPGLTPFLF